MLAVGDYAAMRQALLLVLAALVFAAPASADRKSKLIVAHGTLITVSASSVNVKHEGRRVKCSIGSLSPKLDAFHPGDKVKVRCVNGILVGIVKGVSAPRATSEPTQTATGMITALSASSLTVHNDERSLTCTLSDESPKLGDYRVGDKVKIGCSEGVLRTIARVAPPEPADTVQTAFGTLTALSASSLTVHNDERSLTCTLGDRSPKLGDFHVGDRVKIGCTNGVLIAIAKVDATPPPVTTTAAGTLAALSPTSLTVHGDGGDLTCTLNDGSPKLGDYHLGDKVKIACTNGVLTAIAKVEITVTMITTGTLVALSPTSLTVHSDGGDRTCTRGDASPSLDGYNLGDRVRATCINGVLTAIARPL
jgi:hypothetical protein